MIRHAAIAASLAVVSLAIPAARAEPHTLVLEPGPSEVTFHLDTTLHEVHGTLAMTQGEVRFDDATGEASGTIVIDARRAETGNRKRDRKMHQKVLESGVFPTITFTPTRVEGRLTDSGRSELQIVGTVAIHGAEHPLTLPVVVERHGDRLAVSSDFAVPYVEWGMKNPSLLFLRVAKEVEVSVHAEGQIHAISGTVSSARTL